jgi:hypothetical protein
MAKVPNSVFSCLFRGTERSELPHSPAAGLKIDPEY